jgi:hypothetical protein
MVILLHGLTLLITNVTVICVNVKNNQIMHVVTSGLILKTVAMAVIVSLTLVSL